LVLINTLRTGDDAKTNCRKSVQRIHCDVFRKLSTYFHCHLCDF